MQNTTLILNDKKYFIVVISIMDHSPGIQI